MHSTFVSSLLLLSTTAFALPKPKPADSFRVYARRDVPNLDLQARDVVSNETTIYDGGWYFPVLLGGQEVLLNIDTGSSDL